MLIGQDVACEFNSPVDQRQPCTPNTGQCEPACIHVYMYTNLYISYYHELTTNIYI